MTRASSLGAMLAATYLGVGGLAWLLADRLVFRPPAPSYELGPWLRFVRSANGDRIAVAVWERPEALGWVLYSHGNAEDLGSLGLTAQRLNDWGWSVVAYDYPGYGRSSGRPSERGLRLAAEAVYDYAVANRRIPPRRLVVVGRSLGGVAALHLAAHRVVGAVVLESAFVSAFRVVTGRRLFPWDRFDNLRVLRRVRVPVAMVHGTADRTVPFSHALRLWTEAPPPKRALWVEGADHNNVVEAAGERYRELWAWVQQQIERPNTTNGRF
jgi:fermentation-respiration switch protein FrsA (DUF1100 family)